MLQEAEWVEKRLDDYIEVVGREKIEEVRELAVPLQGVKVLHINATIFGGGVVEILQTLVPLMRDVGLDAHWQAMKGGKEFFTVTKAIHNGLQGMPLNLTEEMKRVYLYYNEVNARLLGGNYDFVIVHDPQPAAILHFHGKDGAKWIWRSHIDTSTPTPAYLDFIEPYLALYDCGVFTMKEYIGANLSFPKVAIIPPSIDPLSPKNIPLPREKAREMVGSFGIDLSRPLLVQVSRFDPWKDPLGVIDTYRLVKEEVPEVQLALVGSMASDDPEGLEYYDRTLRHAGEDFDIYVLSNLNGVDSLKVNAFQSLADVVIQKSIREGFGLVVTEAMWKGKPVVGSKAGGIPLQVVDGETGFLVNSVEECAERALFLLRNPDRAKGMGKRAKEKVKERFLCVRYLADYLRLLGELL